MGSAQRARIVGYSSLCRLFARNWIGAELPVNHPSNEDLSLGTLVWTPARQPVWRGCGKTLHSTHFRWGRVAAAKALPLFSIVCGTTEVVPCYKAADFFDLGEFFRGL
jgi:hypothetical protein